MPDSDNCHTADLLVFALFALLICNTAGSLARRLAGSLAFAASAGFSSFRKIARY